MTIKFVPDFSYLDTLLKHLQSKCKVVRNQAKFSTFWPPKFLGCRPQKFIQVIMPTLKPIMWQSIVGIAQVILYSEQCYTLHWTDTK